VVALLFHNGICSARQQGNDQKNALRPDTFFRIPLINIRCVPVDAGMVHYLAGINLLCCDGSVDGQG
jgi:hypothetical protein